MSRWFFFFVPPVFVGFLQERQKEGVLFSIFLGFFSIFFRALKQNASILRVLDQTGPGGFLCHFPLRFRGVEFDLTQGRFRGQVFDLYRPVRWFLAEK